MASQNGHNMTCDRCTPLDEQPHYLVTTGLRRVCQRDAVHCTDLTFIGHSENTITTARVADPVGNAPDLTLHLKYGYGSDLIIY